MSTNNASQRLSVCAECRRVSLCINAAPKWSTHHYVCEGCFSNGLTKCSDCDVSIHHLHTETLSTGEIICSDCYDQYSTCARCDNDVPSECSVWIDSEHDSWCESCRFDYASRCEGCGDIHAHESENECRWYECESADLCSSCAEERDLNWCGDCDEYERGRPCSDSRIHEYSYHPDAIFHTSYADSDAEQGLFIGLELEVEAMGDVDPDAAAEYVKENFSDERAYCKHDSSLDNGVEIVTHPHSPAALIGLDWDGLTETLRRDGFRSWDTDTAGIHTHVSREYLGTLGLAHFILMAYTNQRTLTKLAGRNSDKWAAWDPRARRFASDFAEGKKYSAAGRYTAINLENSHTVEMRIWRGSLEPKRIRAYVEAVAVMAVYARYLADNPHLNVSHSLAAAIKHYERVTGRRAASLRDRLHMAFTRA